MSIPKVLAGVAFNVAFLRSPSFCAGWHVALVARMGVSRCYRRRDGRGYPHHFAR